MLIATKVGSDMGQGHKVLRKDYIVAAAEASLRRLQVDCIDLYQSLAAGFLTGKYRSPSDFGKSARGPGMKKYLNPCGLKILDALDQVAARYRATPAQIALAWLIARPGVTAPIASATSVAQLADLLRATTLELDAEAMRALDA